MQKYRINPAARELPFWLSCGRTGAKPYRLFPAHRHTHRRQNMTKSTRQAVPSDAASSRKGDAKPRKKARRFPISWRKWNWVEHLIAHPEDASVCPWWSFFDGGDWRSLLAAHPELADRCDWSKLEGWDWSHLLAARPEFADWCDWSKLSGGNWSELLQERPKFAKHCDWSKLDKGDCSRLLWWRPQFIRKCNGAIRG